MSWQLVLVQDFHQEIVEAVGLSGTVSLSYEADSTAQVELSIECPCVDVPSILCSVTGSILVEGLKTESNLRWYRTTTDQFVVISGIQRAARWESRIVADICDDEYILVNSISYANNGIMVNSSPGGLKGCSDLDGGVGVKLSSRGKGYFEK